MCGIVAIFTINKNLQELLLDGLNRLSYRGYDSSGLGMISKNTGCIKIIKAVGNLQNLEAKIKQESFQVKDALVGIAHTRWATHGGVTIENAHPLCTDKVALVHNGIIENYHQLKKELISEGWIFNSQTDTELIAILITKFLLQNPHVDKKHIIKMALNQLHGSFSLAIIFKDDPENLYGYKNSMPLLISFDNNKQNFCLSSDLFAIINIADNFVKVKDEEMVILNAQGYQIFDKDLQLISSRQPCMINKCDFSEQSKGGYAHYMLKEIYEQPEVLTRTIAHLYDPVGKKFMFEQIFGHSNIPKILKIIGCGSSYIAANIGCLMIAEYAGINCFAQSASEANYVHEPLSIYDALICISQSGETADILSLINRIKNNHCQRPAAQKILAITNNSYSSLAQISDGNILTKAGNEISVASTKTFTTQLISLFLLGMYLADLQKNTYLQKTNWQNLENLIALPKKLNNLLHDENYLDQIKKIADFIVSEQKNIIFIGRGIYYHIACEGSLKLKEISYINCQSFLAGELKHGPLALLDETYCVISMCPENELYEKNIISIEEIIARNAYVAVITDKKNFNEYFHNKEKVKSIIIDYEYGFLTSPFFFTLSVQLLSYFVALKMGRNIDQPRNLAKSVTVE